MALTPLQARVARDIIALVRRDRLRRGDHLNEAALALRIGTSRSPVNVALRHLATLGIARHDPNRGFFMGRDASECHADADPVLEHPDEPLYLRLAQDRLARALPDEASEALLMRRYDVARSTLRSVLARIQHEGWAERMVGQGWRFLGMIDSRAEYEESYLFRQAVEPAGLLAASFRADAEEREALRQRQEYIAAEGCETMTPVELFAANSEFHETLARWSGNRFFLQSVQRVDSLRRLVEYSQRRDAAQRRQQALEHLDILAAIAAADPVRAAALMSAHLDQVRREKIGQVAPHTHSAP
jgi:DNA-binding GntR family transcriptional regulator